MKQIAERNNQLEWKRLLAAVVAFAMVLSLWAGTTMASYGAQAAGSKAARAAARPSRTADAKIVQMAAGYNHALALTADGRVFSWGIYLGDTIRDDKLTPELIDPAYFGGKPVKTIVAGLAAAGAITSDGKVYAWGDIWYPYLGAGTIDHKITPELVEGFGGEEAVDIAMGENCYFVKTKSGKVYGWGNNTYGQIGTGTTYSDVYTPTRIRALDGKNIKKISGAENSTVVLTEEGEVYSWGCNNAYQLGHGNDTNDAPTVVPLPTRIEHFDGMKIVQASTRFQHSIVMTEDGKVYTWGSNYEGEAGDTSQPGCSYVKPVHLSSLDNVPIKSIEAGNCACFVLTTDRKVYGWGNNESGGLADDDLENKEVPTHLPKFDKLNVDKIFAGGYYAFVLTTDGKVYAFGDNMCGQLGDGTGVDKSDPTLIHFQASGGDVNGGSGSGSNPDLNIDTNGDGKPDLNIDTNGDGKPDLNIDINGDGKPDLNIDINGDGKPDLNVDTNGDGKPDLNIVNVSKALGIASTQKTVYVKRGKTVKLPFVAYSVIRGKQIVLWKSSKPKVATVRKGKAAGELSVKSNANSKLTIKAGKKLGTSKITLTTVNGKRFVIKVKVVKDLKAVAKKSVKIRKLTVKAAKRLRVGQTKRLKASFTKKATAIATWKSSNPKVAKIDASGKLTAVKKGKAKITLKVGGNKKVIKITVR